MRWASAVILLRFPVAAQTRMPALTSSLDPRSQDFLDNAAYHRSLVDELDTRIHQVRRAIDEDPGTDEFTGWHKRLGRVLYKGK